MHDASSDARRMRLGGIALAVIGAATLLGVLTFTSVGIGQDDAAILLAATELPTYRLWSPGDLQHDLLFRLFNYSHGWATLVWTWLVYAFLNVLHIPLATWALILPGALLMWATAASVYAITRMVTVGRWPAISAMVIAMSTPAFLGIARSGSVNLAFAVFTRTFVFAVLIWALRTNSRRARSVLYCAWALMVVSENAFPITIALSVLLILLWNWDRLYGKSVRHQIKETLRRCIAFLWHPFLVIPVAMLAWYGIAYWVETIHPFGYGFIRYTIGHRSSFASAVDPALLVRIVEHLGIGFMAIAPVAIIGAWWIRAHARPRDDGRGAVVLTAILWAIGSVLLVIALDPSVHVVYVATAIPPLAVLVAMVMEHAYVRHRVTVIGMMIIMLASQGIEVSRMIWGRPFPSPELYGAAHSYRWSVPFKAVGTILRSAGYHPDRYRVANPPPDDVVFAGVPHGVVLYPGVLYWGTVPITTPDARTRIIVAMVHVEDVGQRRTVLAYAKSHSFGLRHVVYADEQPVAWMYEREYRGEPERHDQRALMRTWDRRYANLRDIRVPGRAGPHAL